MLVRLLLGRDTLRVESEAEVLLSVLMYCYGVVVQVWRAAGRWAHRAARRAGRPPGPASWRTQLAGAQYLVRYTTLPLPQVLHTPGLLLCLLFPQFRALQASCPLLTAQEAASVVSALLHRQPVPLPAPLARPGLARPRGPRHPPRHLLRLLRPGTGAAHKRTGLALLRDCFVFFACILD